MWLPTLLPNWSLAAAKRSRFGKPPWRPGARLQWEGIHVIRNHKHNIITEILVEIMTIRADGLWQGLGNCFYTYVYLASRGTLQGSGLSEALLRATSGPTRPIHTNIHTICHQSRCQTRLQQILRKLAPKIQANLPSKLLSSSLRAPRATTRLPNKYFAKLSTVFELIFFPS